MVTVKKIKRTSSFISEKSSVVIAFNYILRYFIKRNPNASRSYLAVVTQQFYTRKKSTPSHAL